MTDKEAIQYVISKVNNADEKGVELTEFDINKVETLISIINRQQAEIERLNNLKRFEKFISERIHTDKKHNVTWDFATREAEQEAFEQELEKLFDISTARTEAIKEFVEKLKEDLKINNYIVSFDRIDNLVKEMVGK